MAQSLQKFYFTYGTDPKQPFCGGWSVICAPTIQAAWAIFKAYHPNPDDSETLNCAWYYTAEEFEQSDAFFEGNFGAYCHEQIGPFSSETPKWRLSSRYSVDGEVGKKHSAGKKFAPALPMLYGEFEKSPMFKGADSVFVFDENGNAIAEDFSLKALRDMQVVDFSYKGGTVNVTVK